MDRKRQRLSTDKDDIHKQCRETEAALRKRLADMEDELKLNKAENEDLLKRITTLENKLAKNKYQLKYPNAEIDELDEHMATFEQKLADKGARLNLKDALEEEEKDDIRRLMPEHAKLKTELKPVIEQLLLEKEQIEQMLKENEKLSNKVTQIAKRVIGAEEKVVDFCNEVEESNICTSRIKFLPNEILVKIFSFLGQNELVKIAGTCRNWSILTKSPILWKIVKIHFHDCKCSQETVAERVINALPTCVKSIKLNFGYMSESLRYIQFQSFAAKLHEKCPQLEILILGAPRLSGYLPSVIESCTQFLPNLRKLALYSACFSKYPDREFHGSISKIEILDFSFTALDHLNKPLFSLMPNLKQLRLACNNIGDSWFEGDISFFNNLLVLNLASTKITTRTSQLIGCYGNNLVELYLCYRGFTDDAINFSYLVLPRLETICLNRSYGVTCEDITTLTRSCQSLQKIYITQEVNQMYSIYCLDANCGCKLEIVKRIDECHHTDEGIFDKKSCTQSLF